MTIEQIVNVSFDAWSALFFVILFIGTVVSRRFDFQHARILMCLLIVSVCLNLSEIVAYVFRGNISELGFFLVRISNFVVFVCNHLVLLFAGIYIIVTIESKGGKVPRAFKVAFVAILAIGLLLLALSRLFDFYYAFDAQNRYYRIRGFWLLLTLQGVVIIGFTLLTLANWRKLIPLERASFLMVELLPVVAIVMQLFTYGISLTTFASTISIAMIFMTFEYECAREIITRERKMLDEVIMAMAQAIDAKDANDSGHSSRVAKYSRLIAEKMGLSKAKADRVFRVAALYDVGKLSVPEEVLNKPTELTREEFQLVKDHTVQGDEILKGITSMPELSSAAHWHHERVDGRGYPDALRGDDIPLEARIIAVADSYDAMTSDRPYRKHLTQEAARQEILDNMGTQFDPVVAQVMIDLIDEDTEFELHG